MHDKREQRLYWPDKMLEEIQEQAVRLDASLSYCVQLAWKLARKQIVSVTSAEGMASLTERYGQGKRGQSLFFPEDMLREIQGEASRLDTSLSWVVNQAWALAVDEVKTRAPRS